MMSFHVNLFSSLLTPGFIYPLQNMSLQFRYSQSPSPPFSLNSYRPVHPMYQTKTDSKLLREHQRTTPTANFKPFKVVYNSVRLIRYLFAHSNVPVQTRELKLPLSQDTSLASASTGPTSSLLSNQDRGGRDEAFSLGILSDIQYARKATKRSVTQVQIKENEKIDIKRRKAYKEAIEKLKKACMQFNRENVDIAVNLGDIVEGYKHEDDKDFKKVETDLNRVLQELDTLNMPIFHTIGNHCRSIPKRVLYSKLKLSLFSNGYYARDLCPGWKLIFLNSSQICPSAIDCDSNDSIKIKQFLEDNPRHDVKHHHYHGAVDTNQLHWLNDQLDEAIDYDKNVMIFSHYPLAYGSARSSHVLANCLDVRNIIEKDYSPVVLCMSGHDHLGGFLTVPKTQTRGAITYATFPAILEAPANGNAFAIVRAYSDGSFTIDGGEHSPVTCAVAAPAPNVNEFTE